MSDVSKDPRPEHESNYAGRAGLRGHREAYLKRAVAAAGAKRGAVRDARLERSDMALNPNHIGSKLDLERLLAVKASAEILL